MTNAIFIAGWLVLWISVLAWEALSLADDDKGDTLSEQVWSLMKYWPSAALLMGLWFWLTWHWFIEPQWFEYLRPPVWVDDYIATGLGVLSAYWFKRR